MKKFYPFLFAVILAVSVSGQTASIVSPSPQAAVGNSDTNTTKLSGIIIPAEKARPITIPKLSTAITIDGRPVEDEWKNAAVFKDFYQTSPGDNTSPSKPTEVLMMYDEKHLYIAFKCWDEKDKVRATVAKRDDVFGEDNVRVWLDTYNDQRRAYVLGFNPFGVQQDGIFTEGRGADFSVDIVMESKGVIEDWGWSVEVKLPFKSLRYAGGKGKLWGFNAARNINRFNNEFDQWLPDDRNISGFLNKHGKITGLDEIKYERTLEIVPSVTLSQTGRRVRTIPRYILNNPATNPGFGMVDPGRFVNFGMQQDIGVTLKYTISPNVTLDAAINPDFAEIEADAPVITANQRFPIFFQEKRPFFLEGQDVFQTPNQLFYSRTIIDPDAAVKLTGKIGKTSFGFLVASDKAPGNYEEDDRNDTSIRPRFDEFIDKSALFGVLRLKRDTGKENNIGFMATYRGFPEQRNVVASFDGRFKHTPKLTSQFQIVGTNSRRCFFDPEFDPALTPVEAQRNREICGTGTFNIFSQQTAAQLNRNPTSYNTYRTGNGAGYYFNLDYSAKLRGWFFEVAGRSKDYRTDAGFSRRVDTNNIFFANRLSTESKPKAAIIRADWRQQTILDVDWKGRLQNFNLGNNINLNLQKNLFISAGGGIYYEKLYEEEFGIKRSATRPGTFAGEATRAAWQQYFNLNVNQRLSKSFIYSFNIGMAFKNFDYFGRNEFGVQDPGTGTQFDAGFFAEYKPTDELRISLNYRKRRLVRDDNRVRAYDSDVVSLKSTYQFTRFIFARVRLDYASGAENYSGQALIGWNPSPGTAIYAGYNDNLNYNGFNPYTGQFEPRFERNSRAFFIRASYLFRKSF